MDIGGEELTVVLIQFLIAIILVSNDNIEDTCYVYDLLGRLQVVNANCCYRQG